LPVQVVAVALHLFFTSVFFVRCRRERPRGWQRHVAKNNR